LAEKAAKICVAYDGMEKFFPADKIVLTGNPVRKDLINLKEKRREGYNYFKLDSDKKTILVVGGSLGARTINQSMIENLDKINKSDVQFIWQTGKYYYEEIVHRVPFTIYPFISRMDLAYSVADLIISRAGAGSISEFCLVGKPVILVPSPNVAEDHQTKNAMALVQKGAAILVSDADAPQSLIPLALETIHNERRLKELSANIKKLALPDAANKIVSEIEKIIKNINHGITKINRRHSN